MKSKLLGSVLSPFVRKVRVFLAEKGVNHYEFEDLIPFLAPPEFTDISPLRKIPVYQEIDGNSIWSLPDSTSICLYLEKKYPQVSLYPEEPRHFADALWIEEYADTDFSNTIGQQIFRPVVVQTLMGEQSDLDQAQSTFDNVLPVFFDYFDKVLAGNQYFVGSELSIADISVAVHFQNLMHAGFTIDASTYPNLSHFAKRTLSRDSFKACFEDEERFLRRSGYAGGSARR